MLPHRVDATLLVTYADAEKADAAEREVRSILGKGGLRWTLEVLSDRPPMRERKPSQALFKDVSRIAQDWEIPLKAESSVWPSVAGLAPEGVGALCGVGPIVRDLYTPQEAVQRISLLQRTLLLTQFLIASEQ